MALQLVGRSPQLILKAEIGTVIGLIYLSPPVSLSFPCLVILAEDKRIASELLTILYAEMGSNLLLLILRHFHKFFSENFWERIYINIA
jgi:positive regulator of sigma E activity